MGWRQATELFTFCYNSNFSLFGGFIRLSKIVQLRNPLGCVYSGTNVEWSLLQKFPTGLKFEHNAWSQLTFRYNHVDLTNFWIKNVDSIKKIVFLPPQIEFCISTATFCLLYKIWILFGIHTETLGASALIPLEILVCCQPFLTVSAHIYFAFYIIERVKQNKVYLYSAIIYILRRFPGCIFVVVSVIHRNLMVRGGIPPQPRGIRAEGCIDPGRSPPPASIVDWFVIFAIYNESDPPHIHPGNFVSNPIVEESDKALHWLLNLYQGGMLVPPEGKGIRKRWIISSVKVLTYETFVVLPHEPVTW